MCELVLQDVQARASQVTEQGVQTDFSHVPKEVDALQAHGGHTSG
jgi:hypothetical protein